MKSNTTTRRRRKARFGIATAMGLIALAAPSAASADVTVKVGSTSATIPLRNCENLGASTPDSQTVTVPEINAPVSVGPVVPELGAVTVTLPERGSTQVPIGGQVLEIEVGGTLVNEQEADTPASASAEGPDATVVDQKVTLPASAELVGADTPDSVEASSCKTEAETPTVQQPEQEQPKTEEPKTEEPQEQPKTEQPQEQPKTEEPQPEQPRQETQPQQPEQPATSQQAPAQTETPAQQSTQTTPAETTRRPATSGQDKSKKAKKSKAKNKKKSKAKSKKGKKSKKSKKRRR